jgi:hypothetical protein
VSGTHEYLSAGTRTITVWVEDDDGGRASATVQMTVLDTSGAIDDLIGRIGSMDLSQGVESSLTAKLVALANLLDQNVTNDTPLLALLDAFVKGVDNWYSKGHLTLAQHDDLLHRADLIRLDVLQT